MWGGCCESEEQGQSVTEKGKAPTPEIHIASAEAVPEEKLKEALLHGLPPMLSPTLPADIEEELAKRTPGLHGGFGHRAFSLRDMGLNVQLDAQLVLIYNVLDWRHRPLSCLNGRHYPRRAKSCQGLGPDTFLQMILGLRELDASVVLQIETF